MAKPLDPNAPICCDRPMRRNGKLSDGTQRYRCPKCCAAHPKRNHGGYRHGIQGRSSVERKRDSRARHFPGIMPKEFS